MAGSCNPIILVVVLSFICLFFIRFVSVDEQHYPDLFFALRGGGGSTWGIVTSLVIRAYPKKPVSTLTYSFAIGTDISTETFWKGIDAVFAKFPEYADKGMYSYWSISCFPDCSFAMAPQWGNNMSSAALKTLSTSLLDELSGMGITIGDAMYTDYDGVLSAIDGTWAAETEQGGVWNVCQHRGSSSSLCPESRPPNNARSGAMWELLSSIHALTPETSYL